MDFARLVEALQNAANKQGREEGEVHRAPPPYQCRYAPTAFYALGLSVKAAPGVDGMTWQDYEADLELRIEDQAERATEESTYKRLHALANSRTACTRCNVPRHWEAPQGMLAAKPRNGPFGLVMIEAMAR